MDTCVFQQKALQAAVRLVDAQSHRKPVDVVLYYLSALEKDLRKRKHYDFAWSINRLAYEIGLCGEVRGSWKRLGCRKLCSPPNLEIDTPASNTGVTPRLSENVQIALEEHLNGKAT